MIVLRPLPLRSSVSRRLSDRQGLARMPAHHEKSMTRNSAAPGTTTATDPAPQAPLPTDERSLRLRKIVFVISAIAFVPIFAAIGSFLSARPLCRCLIGTGVFCAPAVAALWFLGREKQPTLRVWRIFFVVWAMLVLPLLLTVADGVAAQGWPSGKFNEPIAHLLILILTLAVPAFLTSLCSLIRTYRLVSALALVTGLLYLVNGHLLTRATAPARGLRLRFETVLDLVLLGSQMGSYLSLPIGIALIVGGIMTFRAAGARAGCGLR